MQGCRLTWPSTRTPCGVPALRAFLPQVAGYVYVKARQVKSEQFVQILLRAAHEPATNLDDLVRPAGRKPAKRIRELHAWVASLGAEDRARVDQLLEVAAHSALFGALCVLDGVHPVQGQAGQVEFELNSKDGANMQRLNNEADEYLHDIYQALVYSRVYGEP